MKVFFLGDSISTQYAGIRYYGIQLIQQITTTYPEHDYFVVSSGRLGLENTKDIVVPIRRLLPFHFRVRQFYEIPKIIKHEQPDIIIELAHFGPFNVKIDAKKITVIHDLSPIFHKEFHSYSSFLAHKYLLPSIVSDADHLICNSRSTQKSIKDYFEIPSDKISVVYPKVDLGISSRNIEINYQYFLSVGTLEPRKNYVNLINGFNHYKTKGGRKKLIIIGKDGWKTRQLHQAIDQSPHKNEINYLGYVDRSELNYYLANASAYISSSFFEGFGIPVLEAMRYSIPLVLSDIPIYREIAGEDVLYFDPNDTTEIGEKLLCVESQLTNLQDVSQTRYTYFEEMECRLPFL